MPATTCGYGWSGLLIFHGLFQLVFHRHKVFNQIPSSVVCCLDGEAGQL
jgi:hypothetical protein